MQTKLKSAQLALLTLFLAIPSLVQNSNAQNPSAQNSIPGRILGRRANQAQPNAVDHVGSVPKALPSTAPTTPTFTFGMVDFPGATASFPLGINKKAQVVGSYGPLLSSSSPNYLGYRLSGTAFTKIIFPGAIQTFADSLNASGVMAGTYQLADGTFHGFLLVGKTFTKLDYPGAANTEPSGINDSGEIVGDWWNDNNALNAFVYSNGVFTNLQPPGTTFTLGQSINNAGDIVGQFYDSANVGHGYLLHAGAYTVIDYPGAAVTSIDGINNKGQMVGAYGTGGYVLGWDAWNGFLTDSSGTFTSFDAPLASAPVTRPLSINDKGEIAGFYTDVNATYFGFVASFK